MRQDKGPSRAQTFLRCRYPNLTLDFGVILTPRIAVDCKQ